jgi:signal transduction histidine kinase
MADMSTETESATIGSGSRRPLLLARAVFGLTILALVAGLTIGIIDARRSNTSPSLSDLAFALGFVAFPIVGYVLAARRPDNSIGWLLTGIGAAFGLDALFSSYGEYALHGGVGGYHLGALAAAFDGPMWVPIVVLPVTFLIMLFPGGHLPSPRWRWFARVLGAGFAVIFLAILLGPGKLEDIGVANVRNPIGVEWLGPAFPFLLALIGLIPVGIAASFVSLVQRFRRSTGIERLQLRWLVTSAGVVAVLYSIVLPIGLITGWNETTTPGWAEVLQTASIAGFGLIPIAIGVSVLRYRLFEIDVVINRALLFGALAVFITAVYVAIVVGVGALVGSQANPVLSASAAAVVALAFQPARRRAQRFADRLVYGKRATPYEVLSEFSDRLGYAYAADELLPRMARALADGTGAERGDVWVRLGDEFRAEATWPPGEEAASPIPVAANAEGSVTPSSMLEPVRHQGELLGALSIKKKQGESITPTEEKLVRDLAAQAGLVMRNARLIEELRASRQRLVATQDEERRRLERNLHDGAQQQLVAITVKARLARTLTERDPDRAYEIMAELQTDANEALENLRDLARGVYPPLLADKGLVAALEAQARKATVPTTIEANGIGRFPQDVEATVYFCTLEALQNVAKYAEATRATVRLSNGVDGLSFEVMDDGVGFDASSPTYGTGLQGIADRLAALGGAFEISSARNAGTTLRGSVPANSGLRPPGLLPRELDGP